MFKESTSERDKLWLMANAHEISQAIHVAANLGLADLLDGGPRKTEELAKSLDVNLQALSRLVRVLTGIGVLEQTEGGIELTSMGGYLRSGVTGSVNSWAKLVGRPYVWSAWSDLTHSVKTGESAFKKTHGMTPWEYRKANPQEDEIFNKAMADQSAEVVRGILQNYDFSGARVLADIGGGNGALIGGILKEHQNLKGILFDQPHVVVGAKNLLESLEVLDRCETVGGNFFDSVPPADAHILKHIVHDWSDEEAVKILQKCRESVCGKGKILLVELIVDCGRNLDASKIVDLQMLVLLGGRERTIGEFESLLKKSGFELSSVIPTGSPFNMIEGKPI